MDCIGTLTSLALQYGVPLEALMRKFAHQRFEPSGFTKNPEIRNASSIIDYVFRWLGLHFVPGYREAQTGRNQGELPLPGLVDEAKKKINRPVSDLPLADDTEMVARPKSLPGSHGNGNGNGNGNGGGNGFSNGFGNGNSVTVSDQTHRDTTAGHVVTSLSQSVAHFQLDAPTCPNCGHVAVRNGACYKCLNCGESLGCS
jgi:ribonucleoside-diphosphate reductase alpha chain